MDSFIKTLSHWQTLIGAALGPFLLGIGFWIKQIIATKKERRECLRRIEISITHSLDSMYKMRLQLKEMVKRIQKLASDAKVDSSKEGFFLSKINFPPVREVYRDVEASYFKIKSYYLHNKLLWIDASIKEVNEINASFKNDFSDLIRQNELLVTLIRGDTNKNFVAQKMAFANNLENFAGEVEKYLVSHIPTGIEIMTQIKVYNNHLRRPCGFIFRWRNEGFGFNFFCKRIELTRIKRELPLLEQIDKVIQEEVDYEIYKAEKRANESQNNRNNN